MKTATPPEPEPTTTPLTTSFTEYETLATQGVVTSGLTFEQVEEILRDMVARGYVDVDNAPNSGVVVYRFPELAGPFG